MFIYILNENQLFLIYNIKGLIQSNFFHETNWFLSLYTQYLYNSILKRALNAAFWISHKTCRFARLILLVWNSNNYNNINNIYMQKIELCGRVTDYTFISVHGSHVYNEGSSA